MCKAVRIDGSPCRMVASTRDGYCVLCAAMTIDRKATSAIRRSPGNSGELEQVYVASARAAA